MKFLIDKFIRFCLEQKLVVLLFAVFVIAWGVMVAPFDWNIFGLERDPVPVDAIPDIGENQQIVFTEWPGRSPQDIEDQITYPLTVSLLGVPGVKTIRSSSMFGFSSIYIIFKDDVDFYWSRSRILEKLNSLPTGLLPEGVQPRLGPDATALGQVFWYTLEGRDKNGKPAGGWDLHELRTIQDWQVRYALMAAEGISEVASVGGFVKEYQIDVDPDAMRAHNITLHQVIDAVRKSNVDVGARNLEVNKVEYIIRGLGFIKNIEDIEDAVVAVKDNVPVNVKNIAKVTLGPALRRGALDKEGTEVVGGVAVVRFGENPLAAIKNLKKKIEDISQSLPEKTLKDGTASKVTIIPFYDRSGLIKETLGTLNSALVEEILVSIIVVLIMIMSFGSSMIISLMLPLSVLMCFIAMKLFGVDANIVALSGIAIAVGSIVDMGIVVSENILTHLNNSKNIPTGIRRSSPLKGGPDRAGESPPLKGLPVRAVDVKLEIIFNATKEVGGAVFTAVATTVVSFLPVFVMTGAEGKLFKPLAFTKTFTLIASLIVALAIVPPLAHIFFRHRKSKLKFLSPIAIAIVLFFLTRKWMPLGADKSLLVNLVFVGLIIGGFFAFFKLFQHFYSRILGWCLNHKIAFLSIPIFFVLLGLNIWLGFDTVFGFLPGPVKRFKPVSYVAHKFPGLGKEFMPALDEGSYLFMPTTSPHASIGEVLDIISKQDMAITQIPEVESAVGKLGRAETALDPAPVSMIETIINYKPEFIVDASGNRLTFKINSKETDFFRNEKGEKVSAQDGKPYVVKGKFSRDENNKLIPDKNGSPFRLWRKKLDKQLNPGRKFWKGIKKPDDIWDEIVKVSKIPGTTSAPKLQPIAARIVMLQSGMRAPMGVKIKGPDLETIEKTGIEIEKFLKEVSTINPETVNADRIVGKPYLEIEIDRKAAARYGINIENFQNIIETAIGGKKITTTVEGRERYPVRVRYMRELRDSVESLGKILVPAADGAQIPLKQLAKINYVRGPQMIKSEDTFLVGYVLFDKKSGFAEVNVVEQAKNYLKTKIESGEFKLPAGVSYTFAGNYQNQIRAQRKLAVVLPLALFIIFMLLYFHFKSTLTTSLVFSGIMVAWAGGFIMIWFYDQPWFLNFSFLGTNMQELFQVHPINLSVAVWVGFLALFGIASDDGVVMATYLDEKFKYNDIKTVQEIREATIEAGKRRVRPCLMTTATTILALIPVLTLTGRGADIMVPMAIPTVGGMTFEVITMLVVPVLYCAIKERKCNQNL